MENKKIVDYKVISSHYSTFEVGERMLSNNHRNLINFKNDLQYLENNLFKNKLKIEAINKLFLLEIDKQYPPYEIKETIRLKYLLDLSIFNEQKEFKISNETKERLINKKDSLEISIIENEKKIEKLKLEIENLKVETQVIDEINSNNNTSENNSPFVYLIKQYSNAGYVLQGGFYLRDGYGYQAMVKYEE